MEENQKRKSGFGTAGLVLGIIGICLSFIPIVNNAAFVLGLLAVIFGIVTLVKKVSTGKAIAALILGILAVIITIVMQINVSKAVNDAFGDIDSAISDFSDQMNDMTGDNTDKILQEYVNVTLGSFTVNDSSYLTETKLPVQVQNKSDEKKSFSITVEAIDANGTRIDTDVLYANDLLEGQDQTFELFKFVSDEKIEEFKKAEFRVLEASMY